MLWLCVKIRSPARAGLIPAPVAQVPAPAGLIPARAGLIFSRHFGGMCITYRGSEWN